MSTLVEDLLLLARLDQSREMESEPVDVKNLIEECVASARAAGPDHPITLALPQDDLFILGDSNRIHQVVSNLLANARTHTPTGTQINIAASQDERGTFIEVSDQGPGLSAEDQARIFERFYRADTSGNIPGTGLGMSIVQEIASLHQGEAVVESTLGEGTTATLWLPTVAAWRG